MSKRISRRAHKGAKKEAPSSMGAATNLRDNLQWYHARGLLNDAQYDTALLFRKAWEMTNGSGLKSQLARMETGGGFMDEDYQERMRLRVKGILDHGELDRAGKSCLINVVGMGQSIAGWVGDYWPDHKTARPSARGMPILKAVLDLADRLWFPEQSSTRAARLRSYHPFGYPAGLLPDEGKGDAA